MKLAAATEGRYWKEVGSVQDKVRGQFVTAVRLLLGVQEGSDSLEVRRRYLNNQLSADMIPLEWGLLRDYAGELDFPRFLHS